MSRSRSTAPASPSRCWTALNVASEMQMLSEQLLRQLHGNRILRSQSRRRAALPNSGDDLLIQPCRLGLPLIDRPDIIAIDFPCGGENRQGLDSGGASQT